MRFKKILRKIALQIILPPRNILNVRIENVDYHKILEGKKVVVTGATRGIGLAIAKKVASEGAYVVLCGRSGDVLKDICQTIGENVSYLVYDATNCEYETFINECNRAAGGTFDSLILNAGISFHEGSFQNVTQQGFDEQIAVNLKSNYFDLYG